MAMTRILLALSALLAQPSDSAHLRKSHGQLTVLPVHTYRKDCGLTQPLALSAVKVQIPGAGMTPNNIDPFVKVWKDGFYEVDCVADYMFKHGDKFGDHSDEYSMGETSNVSIVLYEGHVAKEDREEMSHEVCFSFCRTIQDMNFFGINNGRECYCATYYQAMADDSSLCDAPCDGNPGTMCGGKSKSSIFGMHACDNTASQLAATEGEMSELEGEMMGLQGDVSTASAGMQSAAVAWQKMFSLAGDMGASDLMQTAKEFAGEMEQAAGAASRLSKTMGDLSESVTGTKETDLTNSAAMIEADTLLQDMGEATTQGAAATEVLEQLLARASPNITGAANASSNYYPLMYFVDKSFVSVPSTCTGTVAEKPMIGTMDSCARACDADVHECVGFSYFPAAGDLTDAGLCFLMSKFRTVKYWAGCSNSTEQAEAADGAGGSFVQDEGSSFSLFDVEFLQLASLQGHSVKTSLGRSAVKCVVKFAEVEGDTLKPDPSGKCSLCLAEATKADRCFA